VPCVPHDKVPCAHGTVCAHAAAPNVQAASVIAELKQQRQVRAGQEGQPPCNFRVVLLGTGAACPSKYRNVTSLYLDFYEKGGMLVDCGEGSWGQLVRCASYWCASFVDASLRYSSWQHSCVSEEAE
jgi:hypothetical protein